MVSLLYRSFLSSSSSIYDHESIVSERSKIWIIQTGFQVKSWLTGRSEEFPQCHPETVLWYELHPKMSYLCPLRHWFLVQLVFAKWDLVPLSHAVRTASSIYCIKTHDKISQEPSLWKGREISWHTSGTASTDVLGGRPKLSLRGRSLGYFHLACTVLFFCRLFLMWVFFLV